VINTPIAETVKDLPVITATVTVLSLDLRVLHAFQLNIQSVHQKEIGGEKIHITTATHHLEVKLETGTRNRKTTKLRFIV